jgi:predicted transport protein
MKRYIAYKAETNFVDVVTRVNGLRLYLNMPFAEINDPKRLCKDYTGRGHWGNGDVRVKLDSLDQLPYAMGLVRQSYERQMGDGGQA